MNSSCLLASIWCHELALFRVGVDYIRRCDNLQVWRVVVVGLISLLLASCDQFSCTSSTHRSWKKSVDDNNDITYIPAKSGPGFSRWPNPFKYEFNIVILSTTRMKMTWNWRQMKKDLVIIKTVAQRICSTPPIGVGYQAIIQTTLFRLQSIPAFKMISNCLNPFPSPWFIQN